VRSLREILEIAQKGGSPEREKGILIAITCQLW